MANRRIRSSFLGGRFPTGRIRPLVPTTRFSLSLDEAGHKRSCDSSDTAAAPDRRPGTFTADKVGEFVFRRITVVGEGEEVMGEVAAVRKIWVLDAASARPQAS